MTLSYARALTRISKLKTMLMWDELGSVCQPCRSHPLTIIAAPVGRVASWNSRTHMHACIHACTCAHTNFYHCRCMKANIYLSLYGECVWFLLHPVPQKLESSSETSHLIFKHISLISTSTVLQDTLKCLLFMQGLCSLYWFCN